jgi:hypothetical protein
VTNSYTAAGLIFSGLFLGGGTFSLLKQKVAKPVPIVLGVCAAMAIAAGVMRW